MSSTVPGRVRQGPRPSSVHQLIRAEPEREERGTEEEWAVLVLSEACSRSGVLWAREVLKAQVHASRVRRRARSERAQAAGRGECRGEPRRGKYESEEDEEWWVGTVRIEEGEEEEEEEEEALEEIDKSEPEREIRHGTSVFMRKDDSGLEDEFEFFWEVHVPSDPDEQEEDRW